MKNHIFLVLSVTSIFGLLFYPRERSPSQRVLHAQVVQAASSAIGQDATLAPDPDAKLVFGDGDNPPVYAIGGSRMVTYTPEARTFQSRGGGDFRAMVVGKIVTFETDTTIGSISSDGRKAIIAVGNFPHSRLFLLDTVTGQRDDIPPGWYDPGYPQVALSGDGRLISSYSEFPMTVTVYDWATKTLVVKRSIEDIHAGGVDGGGVTVDGAVEFANNRDGSKIVSLKTGNLIGQFGPNWVRSLDGAWVVEFPNRSFNESASAAVLLKQGTGGQTVAQLGEQIPEDELYGGMRGAFCGTSGRFILGSGHGIAAYAIPSGKLLTSFSAATWRDASADVRATVSIACSSNGIHVAILSGKRLSFHDLR